MHPTDLGWAVSSLSSSSSSSVYLSFQVYQNESQSDELSEEEEEGKASEPALTPGEEGSQQATTVSPGLILKRSYRAMGTAKDKHTQRPVFPEWTHSRQTGWTHFKNLLREPD